MLENKPRDLSDMERAYLEDNYPGLLNWLDEVQREFGPTIDIRVTMSVPYDSGAIAGMPMIDTTDPES